MKNYEMLSGVNKKCTQCAEDCKQYKQVAIVYCPNYVEKSDTKEKCI